MEIDRRRHLPVVRAIVRCSAAVAVLAGGLALGSAPVSAAPGGSPVSIVVRSYGDDDATAYSPVLLDSDNAQVPLTEPCDGGDSFVVCFTLVPSGTYSVDVPTDIPPGLFLDVSCQVGIEGDVLAGSGPTFTVTSEDQAVFCDVSLARSFTVYVDKVVDNTAGGTAVVGDFTMEVYDSVGALEGTGVDPNAKLCGYDENFILVTDACASFSVDPFADYQLGEVAVNGYAPTDVVCDYIPTGKIFAERFPADFGTFRVNYDMHCVVTNDYTEAPVKVSKVVDNSSGGAAASASAFTLELFDTKGVLVTSGQCGPTGVNCIDKALPVGTYFIGETGPAGYTPSVSCTTVAGPLPTTTTTEPSSDFERFGDGVSGRSFVLTAGGSVSCLVTNVAPTTTTAAPVTTVSGTLPATGSDGPLRTALVAGLLVMLGGAMLLTRRARTI